MTAVGDLHAAASGLDTISLVVPCYNEARRLNAAAFLEALQRYSWLRVLFVNDGSTDETAAVLDRLTAESPHRLRVLHLPHNMGKAEAVRRGLHLAMEDAPLCGYWDADLAAPLVEVAALRQILVERADIEWVFGIRLRALGRHVQRRALRHYLGRLFATASSMLLGIDSYDTQCGAKVLRTSAVLRDVISTPFQSRWIFDVEMLTRAERVLGAAAPARALGEAVYEAPLSHWEHKSGSKVRASDFVRACLELLRLRREQRQWAPLPVPEPPTRP